MGHSTSDDPNRYRPTDDLKPWAERDPLARLRQYLERRRHVQQGWGQPQLRRCHWRQEATVRDASQRLGNGQGQAVIR
ncbi:MAG: thiamine pyrophosphate-dependent enzyme [Pseudomonadota bacterium]